MLIIFCAEIEEAQNIKCPGAKIVITGPGMCNILQTPKLNIRPGDKIINVGYAGSNVYHVGEVLSPSYTKRLTPSLSVPELTLSLTPCYTSALCYTADDFVGEDYLKEIPLVDMELYYLASIYPQIESIKIVSDNLNYKSYKTVNLNDSWEIVNRILRNL